MRGTPSPPGRRVSGLGIIPAYAGNTPQAETSSARSRDHPRVCGEHCRGVPADLLGRGSSPRMRGTRIVSVSRPDKPGIIPAYAGNTVRLMRDRPNGRDHPRVCGEHRLPHRHPGPSRGSSPRMRGTPVSVAQMVFLIGIIPAYAGNTPPRTRTRNSARDHPRVCGEHSHDHSEAVRYEGSSPRMRGTLHRDDDGEFGYGIIPAYAGNTTELLPWQSWHGDHPRVCGEHVHFDRQRRYPPGSSPRMRGTPSCLFMSANCMGIIPAYAGNTV